MREAKLKSQAYVSVFSETLCAVSMCKVIDHSHYLGDALFEDFRILLLRPSEGTVGQYLAIGHKFYVAAP